MLGVCALVVLPARALAEPNAAASGSGAPPAAPAPSAKAGTNKAAAKPNPAQSSTAPSATPSASSAPTYPSLKAGADKSSKTSSSSKSSKASGTTGSNATVEKEPPIAKPTVKHDSAAGQGSGKGASDSARKLFTEAEQAFAAGDYRKAIELFRKADEQAPRAELEYNIALAYEAQGDKASALESYRAYLRRAPTSSDRTEVEANIVRLAKELGKVEQQQLTVVTAPAGATVLIDAQPKGFSPWTGEVPTGRHQLTVRRIGNQEAMQNVSMGVDQPVEVSLVLKEDPTVQAAEQTRLARERAELAERNRPTLLQRIQPITWGLMGAGAAGLVGAGAFEQARANSEDDARMAATQLAAEHELDSAESQQTTARILLGVGAGAMVLGGVFLYIDLSREPDSSTQLTAGCAGRRCGVYAKGQF
jgi:tetratricopeptide (TPR) repeat protein